MKHRPIRKLALLGSVRQLHAVEFDPRRYLGLLGGVAVTTWVFWLTPRLLVGWVAYAGALAMLVAICRPWHRELHLSMDSPVLRLRTMLLGVVPIRSHDHVLEGRRLAVERRVVPYVPKDDYAGCVLFFLPFPIGWFLSAIRSPADRPSHVTQWVLCLRGVGSGTEDLAHLKHARVAASFLAAAEALLPEHVESE